MGYRRILDVSLPGASGCLGRDSRFLVTLNQDKRLKDGWDLMLSAIQRYFI